MGPSGAFRRCVSEFLRLVAEIADDVAAPCGIAPDAQRAHGGEFGCALDSRLDLGVTNAGIERPPTVFRDRGSLYRLAAQASCYPLDKLPFNAVREGDGASIIEEPRDGVQPDSCGHFRTLAARHLHNPSVNREVTNRFREPLVMGEHDDLQLLRRLVEHPGQTVDAGRVHRLHRVVDNDESKRASRQGRPRQEQAE